MGLLDTKERDILFRMAQGKPYRQIGRELKPPIAERSVAKYVSDIFVKLGARDKAHAVALGIINGELTQWQQYAVSRVVSFTPREDDVLRCIDEGQDVPGMALKLGISPKSVQIHVDRIFAKIGVHSFTEAIEAIRQCEYLKK